MESSYTDMPLNVNPLVVNESDEMTHDVGNENDVEVEDVLVTGYQHERGNETLLRGVRQDRQSNV